MNRPDRRSALLDATLRLIGQDGLKAVTHRAVEAAAGLPHGSTTYYFRTREQLIDGAVDRLVELDHLAVDAIGHEIAMVLAERSGDLDYARIAAGNTAWIRSAPELQLARFELYLAGARRPEIRERMRAGRETFVRMLLPIAVAMGSTDPERDARLLIAMLDGVTLHALTGDPAEPPTVDALSVRRMLEAIRIQPDD
jgi:DNA-binding transcriptional regulator YbjK